MGRRTETVMRTSLCSLSCGCPPFQASGEVRKARSYLYMVLSVPPLGPLRQVGICEVMMVIDIHKEVFIRRRECECEDVSLLCHISVGTAG